VDGEVIMKILIGLSIIMFLSCFLFTAVFAGGMDSIENLYFSINIPDSWTYLEFSNTPQAETTGYGPVNAINLTPNEFSDILLDPSFSFEKASEKIIATFLQDTGYRIKNAPLESYAKYEIDKFGILNVSSQQYTTVGKEKAIRIDADESAYYGDTKIVLYLVMHDKEPYEISYFADAIYYEKYLPDFEQMVKSFKFV
jgi:hypothetical protein